jgi:hypothetical protein
MEMLRTGEPEQSLFLVSVHLHFDMGQQFRGILNLVDQQRWLKSLEKKGRIFFGQSPDQWIIQRDIGPIFGGEVF